MKCLTGENWVLWKNVMLMVEDVGGDDLLLMGGG